MQISYLINILKYSTSPLPPTKLTFNIWFKHGATNGLNSLTYNGIKICQIILSTVQLNINSFQKTL